MPASYRRINYSLRPGKAIERRMLCDAFRRLHRFGNVEDYAYVGFGSIYFSDFLLFHRELGIENMLSIEKDAHAQECFEFNKPCHCVRMDFRMASEVLPAVSWSDKTIVWLDYDGKLDETILSDVMTVTARACSGSVLVLSVNASADREPDEAGRQFYVSETGSPFSLDDYRLREFRKLVGENLPPEISGSDLRGKGLADVSRRLIQNKVDEVLSVRNQFLPAENRIEYRQLFNFQYSDGALMLTLGGIFFEANDQAKFDSCSFSELSFARTSSEPYLIDVPCLTLKEMRHLNAQLPKDDEVRPALPGVPSADVDRYAELYRYFPTFTEAVFAYVPTACFGEALASVHQCFSSQSHRLDR